MIRVRLNNRGSTRLVTRLTNRANFFGSDAMRSILQDMGKAAALRWKTKVSGFTPGSVPDLDPRYKKWKKKTVGRAYPILMLAMVMVSSITSRVFRGPPWTVKVWHAGRHYSGLMNQELADIHAEKRRDYMTLPPGFYKTWRNRIIHQFWKGA